MINIILGFILSIFVWASSSILSKGSKSNQVSFLLFEIGKYTKLIISTIVKLFIILLLELFADNKYSHKDSIEDGSGDNLDSNNIIDGIKESDYAFQISDICNRFYET